MALFNKFKYDKGTGGRSDSIHDIVENMNNILNTKKDYGTYLKEYGVRDLNEFNSRDGMIEIIMEEVVRCIEDYEPRVEIIDVIKEEEIDMFKLSFKMECVIKDSKKTLNMVFDTVFNNIVIEDWTAHVQVIEKINQGEENGSSCLPCRIA